MDDVTRLRKCALWRRVAAISAHASSSDASRPTSPRITCVVIRRVMLSSAAVAIVRAAFRETLEVSAAIVRRRSTGSWAATCSCAVTADLVDRGAGEQGARPCAVRSVTSRRCLLELVPHVIALARRELRLVVVAVDSRRGPAVEQGASALAQDGRGVGGVRLRPRACEQHLLDVALGEGPLPRRNLDHLCSVLGA